MGRTAQDLLIRSVVKRFFPFISQRFEVTSEQTRDYNCIAWAANDQTRWWWPNPEDPSAWWPDGVPAVVTVEAFIQAYATVGFVPCDNSDPEEKFEKIALYVDDKTGEPTHAARLLPNGQWTSKLGKMWDIQHRTLSCISGPTQPPGSSTQPYGRVAQILKRPISP